MNAHLHPAPEHFAPVPSTYPGALAASQGKALEVHYAQVRVKAAMEGVYPATVEYLEAADAFAQTAGEHPSPDVARQVANRLRESQADLRACVARVKLEEAKLEQAERELQDAAAAADRLLSGGGS